MSSLNKALEKVAMEEHNLEIENIKRQWLQNKKKRDAIASKSKKTDRDAIMIDSYQGLLDQDKQMIKIMRRKPQLDIIREYLVHLGLDNQQAYLNKIKDPQPFQIRDNSTRVTRVTKRDPYK